MPRTSAHSQPGKPLRDSYNLPLEVLLSEAQVTAKLARRHWQPDPVRGLPGLCVLEPGLDPSLPERILELVREIRLLEARKSAVPPLGQDTDRLRAVFLIRELRAFLRYHFKAEPGHALSSGWQALRRDSLEPRSRAATAQALNDLARLTRSLGQASLPGLEPGLLPEALKLARRLLSGPARPVGRPASGLVPERDRLLRQLLERLGHLREAFRYIFRDHPQIVRKTTSEHRRLRMQRARAALRERAAAEARNGLGP